MKVSNFIRIN